jgi:hypothetical protein
MSARSYRAGDVVRHLALDQEWLLACDEEHGRIAACGWPESWNRVEEVELVLEASDQDRLERLRETAAMKGNDSRSEAARRQLAALASAEGPLDAIERRAKAMGWKTDREVPLSGPSEWLDVTTPSGGTIHYRERQGALSDLVGTTGSVCRHDRALLGRDGEAVDMLRSLTAKAAELRAGLERLETDIVRLTAVVLEVPRG